LSKKLKEKKNKASQPENYKPNPDKPEPRNVCHQGTKARKIFIVLFFFSVLVPSWRKKVLPQKTPK